MPGQRCLFAALDLGAEFQLVYFLFEQRHRIEVRALDAPAAERNAGALSDGDRRLELYPGQIQPEGNGVAIVEAASEVGAGGGGAEEGKKVGEYASV